MLELSDIKQHKIEKIRILRKKLIISRVAFVTVVCFYLLLVMTKLVPISLASTVGFVTAVIFFEIGLLRYDYFSAIPECFENK